MQLNEMFSPKGVAVFGSAGEGKLANILINRVLDGGLEEVYAINPKSQSVRNAKGYTSVLEVEETVDMAVIAAPASALKDIMEDCGKKGIKAAVIISSGFSEAGNADGEKEIMEIAAKYGIRSIGPNCAGLVNTHANLVATLETMPPKGGISIISQSGAIGGSFMSLSAADGVGIAKFLSYGNGGDLTVIELLKYLEKDEDTKVIALYLETVNNGREFMETVKAVSKTKPIVIVKSGRTSTGQRAALSHTGSLAGSDAVFDAAIKQCGAIRVDTLQDLFEVCKGFSLLPEMKGRNLAVITNSGGPGVMTTDQADNLDLKINEPDMDIKDELAKFLPSFAGLRNPVDLTVEGSGEQYGKAIEISLKQNDAAIVLYVGTPYLNSIDTAKGIVRAYKVSKKPIAVMLQVGKDIKESIEYLRENNIPCFASGERAVYVLSKIATYYEYKNKADDVPCFESVNFKGKLFEDNDRILEPEAMDFLKKIGIPVPDTAFARTIEEAIENANVLKYPLVMKVVSPDIIHKSDCGGVKLNIGCEEKIINSFKEIEKAAEGKDFQGVILSPMIKGDREVILGLTNDVQFGPVIAFGMGGVYTEVLKDITFRIAPISKDTALEMIKEIKMYPILKGIRGEKSIDQNGLAEAISTFSQLPFLYDDIQEADLNPVFVYEHGLKAIDVRILKK
ncbi:MAG TPA: hypothetical protein DIC60_09560 [Lachnospiraceae bacterium]|nr:hypothetical protein [Lachnospiraceae bacterium]